MTVRIVRLGTPRHPQEGTRIGTVRRPPRGVPKSEFASGDWYDVWYPNLSPTPELVKRALAAQSDLSAAGQKEWAAFVRGFKAEMKQPEAARTIELLATLSQHADFSVGCYCESEARCHRGLLRELLKDAGAKVENG
jgi:uncharacterized protein YeaO (DUF488 family)